MNNIVTQNSIRFVALLILQVGICNHINFLGYINPYIYIVFILLFPVLKNRIPFLLVSFFIGLCVDIFSDSGGAHAAASVVLAYARPVILKFSFGLTYEYHSIKFGNTPLSKLLTYISIATLLHHLVLFSLEIFSLSEILLILKLTLFCGVFTVILSALIILLFSPKK